MATVAAKNEYLSGSVYGSEAYDLDWVYANSVPADMPLPEREIEHEVPQAKPEVQAKPRKAVGYAISPTACIGFAIAAVMMVFVLLGYIQLNALSNETVLLQSELAQLQKQNSKLLIEYEMAFNLNDIEKYAMEELGMVKPSQGQKVEISTAYSDKAEILAPKAENKSFIGTLTGFVSSLLEYLK